jgi:hypothetical protein
MQHDYEITRADANTGISFRAAVNAALQALATNNAGYDEPANPYPCMWWPDQENDLLKIRNTGNTEWIVIGKLSEPGFGLNEKTLYAAYSILTATEAGAPAPLTIAEDTLLGRLAGGGIAALSVSEVKALLAIATDIGAALTDAASYADALASALDGLKLSKAANLSDINNPADAFANIKQLATEEATGVSRKATMAEAIEGEGNEAHVTPMEAAAMAETKVNPKSQSQGVVLGDGVAGIRVADNSNLQIGVNDFSLVAKSASAYWSDGRMVYLINKSSVFDSITGAAGTQSMRAFLKFNGKLYCVGSGVLYEYDGASSWVSKAPAYLSQTTIYGLLEFQGELYAATTNHGRLFKWNGTDTWTMVADQLNGNTIRGSSIINGAIYAAGYLPSGTGITLLKWNGVNAWEQKAVVTAALITPYIMTSYCVILFNSKICIITTSGAVFEYDGDSTLTKVVEGISADESNVYNSIVMDGKLWIAPMGVSLYSWDGIESSWSQILGRSGSGTLAYDYLILNNELYISISQSGVVLKWDMVSDTWQYVGGEGLPNSTAFQEYNNELYFCSVTNVLRKYNPKGYLLGVFQDKLFLRIGPVTYHTTARLSEFGVVDAQMLTIVASVKRETVSQQGEINFYINSRLFETISIPNGVPVNLDNTANLYLSGHEGINNSACAPIFAVIYSRALSKTDIKLIDSAGVSYADRITSRAAIYTSNFSAGVDGWASSTGTINGNIDGIDGLDDVFRFYANSNYGAHIISRQPGFALGKTYEITIIYLLPTGNTNLKYMHLTLNSNDNSFGLFPATDTWKTITIQHYATSAYFYFRTTDINGYRNFIGANSITDDLLYIASITIKPVGVLGLWEPNGIQPAPGQWLDSSGNNLHALQPATGTSLVLAQNTFEVRWVNTWAGTHEAQYIGGVNQNILPPGAYIQDIIGIVSGSTGQNIIVGDGSTTNRFVASVALVNGTQVFTPANRMLNGTNAKLVADPDVNITGSISWIIRGIIL